MQKNVVTKNENIFIGTKVPDTGQYRTETVRTSLHFSTRQITKTPIYLPAGNLTAKTRNIKKGEIFEDNLT